MAVMNSVQKDSMVSVDRIYRGSEEMKFLWERRIFSIAVVSVEEIHVTIMFEVKRGKRL